MNDWDRMDHGVGDVPDEPEMDGPEPDIPVWTVRTEHREFRVYHLQRPDKDQAIAEALSEDLAPDCVESSEELLVEVLKDAED